MHVCMYVSIYIYMCVCVQIDRYRYACMCIPLYFVHVCFIFVKTCICFYLSWSIYVYVCMFLYLQYRVNVFTNCQTIRDYNSFKQFSSFLVKEESVSPNAFSSEFKPFCKTQRPFKRQFIIQHVTSSYTHFSQLQNNAFSKIYFHIFIFGKAKVKLIEITHTTIAFNLPFKSPFNSFQLQILSHRRTLFKVQSYVHLYIFFYNHIYTKLKKKRNSAPKTIYCVSQGKSKM